MDRRKEHDPTRQVDFLRQVLVQGKKPIGLFVGAGCPSAIRIPKNGNDEPLIPAIDGLTEQVCQAVAVKDEYNYNLEALLSSLKVNGVTRPNIEDILDRVRSLQRVAGQGEVHGLTSESLENLDKIVCDTIVTCMDKSLPGLDTPYHKTATWAGAIVRDRPVEIFTTNYDLLIEQAFEKMEVPYYDGFVGSCQPFFYPHSIEDEQFPPSWIRLWKIHGSINWYERPEGGVFRGQNTGGGQRRVIYPSHLKYEESRRMPYLAMVDRLRGFFRTESAVLITCGYSFRDQHLNDVIFRGLQGNPKAMVFGLLYGSLEDSQEAKALALQRSNLSILARDGAVIGTSKECWVVKAEVLKTSASRFIESAAEAEDLRETEYVPASFLLGDFTKLGELLSQIVGGASEEETG